MADSVYLDLETKVLITELKKKRPDFNFSDMVRRAVIFEAKRDLSLDDLQRKRLDLSKKKLELEGEIQSIENQIRKLEEKEAQRRKDMEEEQGLKDKARREANLRDVVFLLRSLPEAEEAGEEKTLVALEEWQAIPDKERSKLDKLSWIAHQLKGGAQ